MAVADDGLLDAIGGELFDAQSAALSGQQNHATCVAHEDGGARMFVVGVKLFDGADHRLEFIEQVAQFLFQFDKPLGEGGLGVELNDTAVDEFGVREIVVDDPVAAESKSWVDADNSHGGILGDLGWNANKLKFD